VLFRIQPFEKKILELIQLSAEELGFPVYIVGGYVRDRLLNRASKDLDIVCVGSGIELAKKLATHMRPTPRVTYYSRFGTAMLKHKDLEIEFVGARKESYRADSRKPLVENGTLEDDQNRRDFTINALAVSLNEKNYGEIVDPFNGLADLERRIVKTPLDPEKTFTDDPLRMLRAIRFATQLDFEIHPVTFEALGKYKNRISIISKERITTELSKIVGSSVPSIGFKYLFDTGLLEIIFPELYELRGVEVRNGIGHKDNFYHTIEVLDNVARATDNIWLRWAAIFHDIAKPATKRFDKEHGWTFHGHEVVGTYIAERVFKRMRLPLDAKLRYVQKMIRLHLRPIALTKEEVSDSAIRRLLFDAGEDIEDLMILCKADITSKNEKKVKRYLSNYEVVQQKLIEVEEKDQLRNWQPPISGELIMETFNLDPCRTVGDIKNAIREAILDGVIPNSYEEAHAFMLQKGKELNV